MATYTLEKAFTTKVRLTSNVRAVAEMFGLGADSSREIMVVKRCKVSIEPGQVVYVTGASGAGKSQILKLLKANMEGVLDLDEQQLPRGRPLVDCFEEDLEAAFNWLGRAGLSEVFTLLRSPEQLSDGQRYRFRLALALARKPKVICIDEFCAALDRVTAAVVAYKVRGYADQFGTTFIVATSHDDLLEDLQPDVVVIKHYGSECDVMYPKRYEINNFQG